MGIAILIIHIIYVLLCILAASIIYGVIVKFIIRKEKKGLLFLLSLLLFFLPYWDLFLQKGIKTYYQVFMSNPTIYKYPEKDKNGKVESFAFDKISTIISSGYLTERKRFDKLNNDYNVIRFIEGYMIDSFKKVNINGKTIIKIDYKKDMGYVRVYLNQDEIKYDLIKDESEFKARYQVFGEEKDFYIFKKIDVKIWDKKENILLGEGSKLKFDLGSKEKFRYKFLFMRAGNDAPMISVREVDNYNKLFKELFGFRLN